MGRVGRGVAVEKEIKTVSNVIPLSYFLKFVSVCPFGQHSHTERHYQRTFTTNHLMEYVALQDATVECMKH